MNLFIKRCNLTLVVSLIATAFLEAQQVPLNPSVDQPDSNKLIHALQQRKISIEDLRSKISAIRQNLNPLSSTNESFQTNEAPKSKRVLKKNEHSAKPLIISYPILEEVKGFVKILL